MEWLYGLAAGLIIAIVSCVLTYWLTNRANRRADELAGERDEDDRVRALELRIERAAITNDRLMAMETGITNANQLLQSLTQSLDGLIDELREKGVPVSRRWHSWTGG